jgi:arylsulfatase A-like enzyme
MSVVLVYDLRWDALGSSGHPFSVTPSIDRLAAAGPRFANVFVVQSLCSPSRATSLTDLYPHIRGVLDKSLAAPAARHPRRVPRALRVSYRFVGK